MKVQSLYLNFYLNLLKLFPLFITVTYSVFYQSSTTFVLTDRKTERCYPSICRPAGTHSPCWAGGQVKALKSASWKSQIVGPAPVSKGPSGELGSSLSTLCALLTKTNPTLSPCRALLLRDTCSVHVPLALELDSSCIRRRRVQIVHQCY